MDRFSNIVNQVPKKKVIYISLIIMVLIIVSLLLMLFTPNVNIATTDEEKEDTDVIVVEPEIQEEPRIIVDSDFIEPVPGGTEMITSRFGKKSIQNNHSGVVDHTGLDLFAQSGTDIKAVADGKVIYSGWRGSYGYLVILEHNDSLQTYYCNCRELNVKEGDVVKQGEVIAQVGSTGNSTGPHLHFEVRENGVAVNPQNYVYGE